MKNIQEIEQKTNQLINLKVSDIEENNINFKEKDKGKIGKIVENYFGIENNSRQEADFLKWNINLELKVIPLQKLKTLDKNNKIKYSPKWRVKLSQINLSEFNKEISFKKTNLFSKMNKTLFIFYEYNENYKESKFIKYKIFDIKENKEILNYIENDFNIIKNKVIKGNAHTISESDTNYLGCVRSGAGNNQNSENKISQPFSNIPVFKRAYCFKNKFIKEILLEDIDIKVKNYESNSDSKIFENIKNMIKIYQNKTLEEIVKENNFRNKNNTELNLKNKSLHNKIFKELLKKHNLYGDILNSEVLELKAVSLDNKNVIKESWKINNSLFKNYYIFKETNNWEDTDFYSVIEKSYITLITREGKEDGIKNYIIDDVKLINFNDDEYRELKKIFVESFEGFISGNFRDKNSNKDNKTYWSSQKNNLVHIRPNSRDKSYLVKTIGRESINNMALWFNTKLITKKINERN